MRIRRLLCLCAAVCALCACMNAGPSTEEGNPQIIATVVDSGNRPVAGAQVIAYLMPVNSDTTAQPGSALNAASTQTDADGSCLFEGLPPGRYSVVATDNAGYHSAIRSDIMITVMVPDAPEFSDTLILAATGSLEGTVTRNKVLGNASNQNLKDGFIQVKIGEIDRSSITGPNGAYSFSNLPAGVYTIYYYATDGFFSAKRENIVVPSGVNTFVDTVILTPVPRLVPPKGLRSVYDTSASSVSLSWQRVLFDSLRWYELERIDLAGPRDTVIICADTLYIDTLTGFPKGTVLDYVIRSVDKAFNRSANAGPVEITVAK